MRMDSKNRITLATFARRMADNRSADFDSLAATVRVLSVTRPNSRDTVAAHAAAADVRRAARAWARVAR